MWYAFGGQRKNLIPLFLNPLVFFGSKGGNSRREGPVSGGILG